jgi:protein dithiol:quinone oxidoreductase
MGLMAYALYSQYVLGLEPCPLCIFQRVAVIALGLVFLLAALHNPGQRGARIYAGLLLVTATLGTLVSSRHIWIQMQPPGSVEACGANLDYLLDILPLVQVVRKVLFASGECATIDWSLLGLSMPWWVAISLVTLAGWALFVNAPARPRTSALDATR